MGTKKDRILIVGANGFVGRALAKRVLRGSDTVSLVSRDKKFKVPGAKHFYGDLTDYAFCKKILTGIDTVYYLASFKKNVSVHTRQPFDAVYENVLPLLTFLEAAKTSSVKRIIYMSSVTVTYAVSASIETDGYVLSKYINEIILKSFAAQTGIDIKIVRSAAVYGPGNDFNPEVANVIPLFIVKTVRNNGDLVLRGRGKRKLQFIYIDDLIENIVAVRHSRQKFFTIGNKHAVEVKSLASKIIELAGANVKVRTDTQYKDKPTKLDKFNNIVSPKTSLDLGLRKTVEYYKVHHL